MGNMPVSLLTLLCSILSLTQALALEERSLYVSGGWGLIISSSTDLSLCPSGTQGHIDADVIICCPPNYTSPDSSGIGSRICCPPGMINASTLILKSDLKRNTGLPR